LTKTLYMNREWISTDKELSILSPYDRKDIGTISAATKEDVKEAIKIAKSAREVMRNLTGLEKYGILMDIARQFEQRKEEAATIIAKEAGKPMKFALAEIDRTIETYIFSAEEAKRIVGEQIPMDGARTGKDKFAYTVREPIGTIAAITPFNFPQNLVAHKVGPAIASGNSILLKPATQTALSAIFLTELINNTTLPKGAFNLITGEGREVGDVLTSSEDVAMITFTGSTTVGKKLLANAGLKKVSLELGSNSGLIISKTKDLETIAKKCAAAAYSNQGQVCISLQRVYVIEDSFEEFISQFKKETEKLVVGDPLDASTDVSSMINPEEQQRALDWINEALDEGAKLVTGGFVDKNVLLPTILVDVPEQSKVCCNEVFAPIVIVNKVKNLVEGVEALNNSIYGLQGAVFTESIEEAFYVQRHLEVGGVIINDIPTYRVDQMPYGGVKESGNTKEGVKYAIHDMTHEKLVIWNNAK